MTEIIKGMDISSIIEEEQFGARYYDGGKEGSLLEILKRYGSNSVRIRIWNNPYSDDGRKYGAGTNDLARALVIGKRAKTLGYSLLLDIQYSDFWADPGKQNVPKAWQYMSEEELSTAVYEYTSTVINAFVEEEIAPEYIQIGNEITNGLLWPTGKKPDFDNIAGYCSAGVKAVRNLLPSAKVVIHLDNGGNNPMYVEWFDNYFARGGDCDIIGLSYYPFWHGTIEMLEANMRDIGARYGKELVIAEVSSGFSMEDYRKYEGLPAGQLKGMATRDSLVENVEYPMTPHGQAMFMERIMRLVKDVPGAIGFYYWEPGWIPVPGCGWATEAALEYTKENGPGGNEWANQALFDYNGRVLEALGVIRDFR